MVTTTNIIIFALLGLIVGIFVGFQLKWRRFAAQVEAATTNLITCILSNCTLEIDLRPYEVSDRRWPKGLRKQIEEMSEPLKKRLRINEGIHCFALLLWFFVLICKLYR